MRLSSLTAPELLFPEVPGFDPPGLLRSLAQRIAAAGAVESADLLYERLWEREQLGSTGIGRGVAVPHCKVARLDGVILAVAQGADPIEFGAVDGKPVQIFFVVVSPEKQPAAHLQCLAAISRWVQEADNVARLRAEATAAGMLRVLGDGQD